MNHEGIDRKVKEVAREGLEKKVAELRFDSTNPRSLTEAAEILGISRFEVRRIEAQLIHRAMRGEDS